MNAIATTNQGSDTQDETIGTDDRRFERLAHRFSSVAEPDKLTILPFTHASTPLFQSLPQESRDAVVAQFETLVVVCESVRAGGRSLRDPVALLWAYFKHSGMRPPSTLQSLILADDFIDVYNDYHQIIFANLRFFEVASFSLEELYCRQWPELFDRMTAKHEEIARVCEDMVSGKITDVTDMSFVGPHLMRELSGHNHVFEVEPRYFAPLFENGKPRGYLCINKAHLVE